MFTLVATVVPAACGSSMDSHFVPGFQRGEISFSDDTDLAAIALGKISVTPLRLDLTDEDSRLRFEKAFAVR